MKSRVKEHVGGHTAPLFTFISPTRHEQRSAVLSGSLFVLILRVMQTVKNENAMLSKFVFVLRVRTLQTFFIFVRPPHISLHIEQIQTLPHTTNTCTDTHAHTRCRNHISPSPSGVELNRVALLSVPGPALLAVVSLQSREWTAGISVVRPCASPVG